MIAVGRCFERLSASAIAMSVGMVGAGIAEPLPSAKVSFPKVNAPLIELGQLLFFDPILSGNYAMPSPLQTNCQLKCI